MQRTKTGPARFAVYDDHAQQLTILIEFITRRWYNQICMRPLSPAHYDDLLLFPARGLIHPIRFYPYDFIPEEMKGRDTTGRLLAIRLEDVEGQDPDTLRDTLLGREIAALIEQEAEERRGVPRSLIGWG